MKIAIIIVVMNNSINTNYTTIIDSNLKYIFLNNIIIYSKNKTYYIFSSIIVEFKNIFINLKNIINISKK